jgi:hypothetical protein
VVHLDLTPVDCSREQGRKISASDLCAFAQKTHQVAEKKSENGEVTMKYSKKSLLVLVMVLAIMLAVVAGAAAVTDGELDGNKHPHVVLLIMDVDGSPTYRCSATMLTPTFVLTAGHCTNNFPGPEFTGMRIFTESDVENGDNTYPFSGGPNSVEAAAWYAHPDYETAPFWFNDVGVVILEEPGFDPGTGVFGALPAADYLDQFKTRRGLNKLWFTAVGYGLQRINPVFVESQKIRMYAEPRLIQINTPGFTGDFSLLLSNNHSTGGTCFGDSGGPNFIYDENIVGGVTSFGLNGNCAGTGGVFRMDRQNVLDFVCGVAADNGETVTGCISLP